MLVVHIIDDHACSPTNIYNRCIFFVSLTRLKLLAMYSIMFSFITMVTFLLFLICMYMSYTSSSHISIYDSGNRFPFSCLNDNELKALIMGGMTSYGNYPNLFIIC